jgi:hypothetical protein
VSDQLHPERCEEDTWMPVRNVDVKQHYRQHIVDNHAERIRLPKTTNVTEAEGNSSRSYGFLCTDLFVLDPPVMCILAATSSVPKEKANLTQANHIEQLLTLLDMWIE